MRYILIFLIVASIVMIFIFADYFPRFLAHYPRLQEANWTVRAWLGMESPHSSRISERKMRETEQILKEQSAAKKQVTDEDLAEYHE